MTEAKSKVFEPVTFWLADPRNGVQLFVESQNDWIKFMGGKYTAQTQEEYDIIKREIGHKVWEQDMTKAPAANPISGYAPMASGALDAHIELVTPIPG